MAKSTAKTSWQVNGIATELAETLKAIPGVSVRGEVLVATLDATSVVQRLLSCSGVNSKSRVYPHANGTSTVQVDAPSLFEWQKHAATALANDRKRILWHSAGLGKTATLLSAVNAIGAKRVLFVTRSIGRDVFARDAAWVCPERTIAIVVGEGDATDAVKHANRRLDDLRARGSKCTAVTSITEAQDFWAIVVPWETLVAHQEPLANTTFDVVVFDEHHMGKGRTAHRAKAATELAKRIGTVWSATATPVRDRLRDLFPQLHAVAPNAWPSSWKFAHRYCDAKPGRWGGLDTTGVSNTNELSERLHHFADVKTRQEVAHLLPAKQRNLIRIPRDCAAEVQMQSQESSTRVEHAIAVAAQAKLPAVVSRATDVLIGQEKCILVGNRRAWVPQAAFAVEHELSKIPHIRNQLWLRTATGASAVAARQALAREFMRQPGPACLVATIDSISESIDLHDADRLIVAALPQTPGQLVQLEGRVHRIGQARPVTIDYYIAEGTIDERIEDLLLTKLDAIEIAGASTEATITQFTRNEAEIVAELSAWLSEKEAQDHA